MNAATLDPRACAPEQLPDGQRYCSWEQPLRFRHTYHVDGSSPAADDSGPGTAERPWRTIGRASEMLQPGERAVIHGGIYRETVRPRRGGSGPDAMISYEAAEGEEVIVRGSAVLTGDWRPSDQWRWTGRGAGDELGPVIGEPRVWQIALPGELFGGYNPFGMLNMLDDTHFLSRNDMRPQLLRRANVWVDGKPLAQALLPYEISRHESAFWAESNGMTLHVRFPGDSDPSEHEVEISTKEQLFVPAEQFLGYIRLKGITFERGANGLPVPQRGIVSAARGHHWIIEGCTIQEANTIGLDLGNESWHRVRAPEVFSQHIVRGNVFRHCGANAIVSMVAQDLLIEDNLIEDVGYLNANNSTESAGIKIHHTRNLLIRRNVMRHIVGCPALWVDYDNANCRITGNIFADVSGDWSFGALHLECNHEWNWVDHNIIWDVRGDREWDWIQDGFPQHEVEGEGICLRGTDHVLIAHNLFGRCRYSAVWPVNTPKRVMGGRGATMREVHFVNNIVHETGEAALHLHNEHATVEGNVYSGFAEGGYLRVLNPILTWLDLPSWQEAYGWDKQGAAMNAAISFDPATLTLTARFPEPLPQLEPLPGLAVDLLGQPLGERVTPGPVAGIVGLGEGAQVDPRVTHE